MGQEDCDLPPLTCGTLGLMATNALNPTSCGYRAILAAKLLASGVPVGMNSLRYLLSDIFFLAYLFNVEINLLPARGTRTTPLKMMSSAESFLP